MAFLNFKKKREELPTNTDLPTDIDLDMPPEPPKMVKEDISTEEPVDEELMPRKAKKSKGKAPKVKEEVAELPPLPEIEEEGLPELPKEEEFGELPDFQSSSEENLEELGETDLPPPPEIKKEKKGLFSFLKRRKVTREAELPEMPSLPEFEEGEISEIPTLPETKELPPLPEEKKVPPPIIEPLKPVMDRPVPEKEVKPVEKLVVKKFITIDNFRQVQGDINNTTSVLKGIDDFFAKLEEIKGSGDKEYSGLYNSLKDVQTNIMFVDKTLFKEEV